MNSLQPYVSRVTPRGHYRGRGLLRRLFPPDATRWGELPLLGERPVAGDLEARQVALAVVVGDLDDALARGIDGEDRVGQLLDPRLGREGDLHPAAVDRLGRRRIAALEIVDAEQQQVETGLVLAVDP